MIAHLLELHEHIQELDSILGTHAIHSCNISCDDFLVELLLKLSKANKHVNFLLGRQVMLYVYL